MRKAPLTLQKPRSEETPQSKSQNVSGAQAQRESGVDFLPWKSKSLSRCSVVVPLEVPRTEMVSLQLLVDLHRNTGIQKQLRKPGQAPRETIGKQNFRKWRGFGDFGWRGFGVDFLGQGKKGSKNPRQIHASFRNKIRAVFRGNPRPNPCREIKKSMASSRPSSLRACSFRCSELSD